MRLLNGENALNQTDNVQAQFKHGCSKIFLSIMDFVNSFLSISSLYKIFSSFFCSIFLVYQSSELLTEYMNGKTVDNIEVKRELYENLPAITLCLSQIISMEKLANFDQEYQQDFLDNNEILSTKYFINSNEYYKIMPKLNEIYGKAYYYFRLHFNNRDFLNIIIDNISLPYDKPYMTVKIEGNFHGKFSKTLSKYLILFFGFSR